MQVDEGNSFMSLAFVKLCFGFSFVDGILAMRLINHLFFSRRVNSNIISALVSPTALWLAFCHWVGSSRLICKATCGATLLWCNKSYKSETWLCSEERDWQSNWLGTGPTATPGQTRSHCGTLVPRLIESDLILTYFEAGETAFAVWIKE